MMNKRSSSNSSSENQLKWLDHLLIFFFLNSFFFFLFFFFLFLLGVHYLTFVHISRQKKKEGIPIRVYSEENLFKTIIVGSSTTVLDAIKSAASKFKGGKPENFTMRMVAGGKGESNVTRDSLSSTTLI